MKKLLMTTIAAAIAACFAVSPGAAATKHRVSADVRATCKQEAAKKFSAIHFMKRRSFENNCIARHASAKAKPSSTAQAAKPTAPQAKPSTTGQAPKAQ
jgi:hypothetical protein